MRKGKVKYYNKKQGYGFIQVFDFDVLIFVGKQALKESISTDDLVKFDIVGERHMLAINVEKIHEN